MNRRLILYFVHTAILFGLTGAMVLVPVCGWAADAQDKKLLGDLEEDLLKDLEKPSQDESGGKAEPKKKPRQAEPPAGEDIGQPGENPLARILQRMRQAERRIAASDASAKTQDLQQEAIDALESLIAQLQQQQQQQQQSGQSSSQQQSDGSEKPQGGEPASGNPSNKPASESTDRLDQNTASAVDAAAAGQLVKAVWGHLPPRIVEQMTGARVEEFLPKYEQLIEDYFRSLAEEDAAGRD